MTNSKRGFTILELLVVVAIIAILTAMITASFSSTRAKGRDAKRLSDMREIQKALALYQIDNNKFPIPSSPGDPVTISGSDEISTTLEGGGYITTVPIDPQHPDNVYTYESNASGDNFTLGFCLETNEIRGYSQGCGNTVSP